MKRLLSLLLAFSIILTLVPTTVFAAPTTSEALEITNPFTDVKEGDWFYDAVQYARINGFFNGTSETTFAIGFKLGVRLIAEAMIKGDASTEPVNN